MPYTIYEGTGEINEIWCGNCGKNLMGVDVIEVMNHTAKKCLYNVIHNLKKTPIKKVDSIYPKAQHYKLFQKVGKKVAFCIPESLYDIKTGCYHLPEVIDE